MRPLSLALPHWGREWVGDVKRRKKDKLGKAKNKPKWQCSRCGICCKFIVIPVQENPGIEVLGYLAAHGIAYDNGRLIIPARCDFLTEDNICAIHSAKFSNCRLGGKKECKNAKKDYETLKNLQAPE